MKNQNKFAPLDRKRYALLLSLSILERPIHEMDRHIFASFHDERGRLIKIKLPVIFQASDDKEALKKYIHKLVDLL